MISQSRYIRIISGVGAGAGVAERELMLRVLTANSLIPAGVVMEFDTPDAVQSFFGAASEEYKRAQRYFAFISKNTFSPQTISFSRWVNSVISAQIVGDSEDKSLGTLKSFSGATLSLAFNDEQFDVPPIDLTTATTLTDVAQKIQDALAAAEGAPEAISGATVTYNTNTQQFVMTAASAASGSGTLTTVPTSLNTDISGYLGWGVTGTVYVAGQGQDTPVEAITKSSALSNNFFSWVVAGADLTLEQIVENAAWNDSRNNEFMYCFSTTLRNASAYYAALKGFSGVAMSLRSPILANDFIDQFPGEIAAATNYRRPNASQNFMYYQSAARNVVVTEDRDADLADAARANYIGVTQQAGQPLSFYQRGVLMGGSQAAVDMNTYTNEAWMKGSITSQLFALFLNVGRVPANEAGKSSIIGVIQTVIDNATVNGTISVGKALTEIQKQYINQQTGDDTAWRQVQTIGYWLDVDFETETTPDGRIEYYATYQLVYSKDDMVRRVVGRDQMI
ncbi:tail sheath protein [Pantoea phage Kyle]|uniref:Tail sheath protein n=1 Tax=Pantoea phage Kyle TaxID=2589665 RepID=A0A514A8I7_9CAUD|nr:tail sheath [Pantoea phage Kyle]QDH49588.1 tail sheath protein [Pantoea phage Kyle]